jgi:mannose-6-phosphate isomerase
MIRLTPSFREKLWGSTRLEPLFPNSQEKIGEVWYEREDFPLLIKFLFTTERLSVQVHPGDAHARTHHDSNGKTEMWYVLAAEPGARIAAGFKEAITPAKLQEASLSGEIEELLQWFDAAPGDTFFIPAGTVHAVGAGLTLCEIQQYSDLTYRLYDYGRPRDLHLDQAAAVSHLGPHPARTPLRSDQEGAGGAELLVSCPYFKTSKFCISKENRRISSHSRQWLIVIEGSGALNGQPTKAGDVWYLETGEALFSGSGVFLQVLP